MIMKDERTTALATSILAMGVTKLSMSLELGITRATLDSRLTKHKWKQSEKLVLKKLT